MSEYLDVVALEMKAAFRSDRLFMGGLETVRRAEAARLKGTIDGYRVLYCESDHDVVDSVLITGKKS